MSRFAFRLDKLLRYRTTLEKQAKDEYLACRAKRIEGEFEIEKIKGRRIESLSFSSTTLPDRVAHERFLSRLDDEQRAVEAAVAVLQGEEDVARGKWLVTKKDLEALQKLREKDLEAWQLEEERKEQRALDEWAVLRRVA